MNLFGFDDPIRSRVKLTKKGAKPNGGSLFKDDGKGTIQPTLEANWVAPAEFIPLNGIVSIDFETRDTTLSSIGSAWAFPSEDDYVLGVAVECQGQAAYYPVRHPEGNFHDPEKVWDWLKVNLARSDVHMIAANSLYDLGWLRRHGIKPANGAIDVQGLAALLDENRLSYSLDNLSKDMLGIGKEHTILDQVAQSHNIKNIFDHLWRLPARFIGPYATQDAVLNSKLFMHLWPQIQAQGLRDLAQLEREVMSVVVEMRYRGIRVNMEKAEAARKYLQEKEDACIRRIKAATGETVSAWEAETIRRAVEAAGLTLPRTATDKASVTKGWLEEHATASSVIQDVLEIRRYNKARTTFLDGHIFEHARNGRIHPEFHPLRRENEDGSSFGTVTGRFSSSNPNFQQLPARDPEVMMLVRGLMEPEDGERWHNADYSSQEPRISLHYAYELKLEGAAEMVQIFQDNPRTDLHGLCAQWMNTPRQHAKTIFLGLCYGMGGAKLCRELGLPTDIRNIRGRDVEVAGKEGQVLLNTYHSKVSWVQPLITQAQTEVKLKGYITTILDRRCRFFQKGGEYMYINKALNRRIQGSAADQAKRSMVEAYYAGYTPLVTEHDALGFSVGSDTDIRRQIEVMTDCMTLHVPVMVDSKVAGSWGAAK